MSELTSNSAVYEVQEGMDRDLNKQFRVTDTRTDSRVATCYVQSNADLVCAALNAYTADEPSAGVKCTHCNGKGYNEPIYDEQDGWTDETPCETCNGSGRITTVEQYLKTLPANWHEDSSLETWFPITAEELKRLKDERASQPPTVSVEKSFEGTRCPFTKRPYFMHIEHPELGRVPTYGGPFDSYTIPVPDDDGERTLRVERYDHDAGDWVEGGEPLRLHVVTDEEFAKLCTAEPPSDAARDVLAERERQKSVEGWTPEHDDTHNAGELAEAAACYALNTYGSAPEGVFDRIWPWSLKWWKPKNRRRDLVRAAALLLADIERIDRAAVTKDAGECGACDKPGEHCANVHGICSRHGGRAHETSAGDSK